MKKLLVSLLALLMLVGCGTKSNENEEVTENSKDEIIEDSNSNVQIANPYVEYETAKEMMDAAKLSISLPEENPEGTTNVIYRAIPDELIEVIYELGEDNEIRIRTKVGNEDISGIYDSDEKLEEKEIEITALSIKLKGHTNEDGEFIVLSATWTTNYNRSYSITSTKGVPELIITPLIGTLNNID